MIKNALFVVALLSPFAARAASHFETLRRYYSEGRYVELSEVYGLRSGRCYTSAEPDRAWGAVLWFATYKEERDGPAFPPTIVTQLGYELDVTPANKWDLATPSDAQSRFPSHDDCLNTSSNGVVSICGEALYIRMNGPYLVLQKVTSRETKYCYFFVQHSSSF